MRITLGNIDGKALGLNIYEICVYAVIEKCSRGDDAKGWFGSQNALANCIPCKIDRSTVTRAIAKLITSGLIVKNGEKLFINVQTAPNTVHTAPNLVQTAPEMVHTALPPNNPPINNINNMKEEKQQSRAHMRTRDDAKQPAAASDLFESFNALKRAWMSAGGERAEFERRGASIWTEWMNATNAKRQFILRDLSLAITRKKQPEHWRDNPLFFVRDYPEPVPFNWNGVRSDPPEPVEIAAYNGVYGMYTLSDIELFNLQRKQP